MRFGLLENLPGYFPFTGGVFPFKREGEDPKRMFAGEGGPARTNERFHYLSAGEPAKRLSTAFDSVTLYGWDPDERPDVFRQDRRERRQHPRSTTPSCCIAASICAIRRRSVSMTINGPAPILLAFYMNTAIDQQVEREAGEASAARSPRRSGRPSPIARCRSYAARCRPTSSRRTRPQNTCIFSIEFALRMMARHPAVLHSEEGAELLLGVDQRLSHRRGGANPITQLAFTLSNGFTFVEYYRARGLGVDEASRPT